MDPGHLARWNTRMARSAQLISQRLDDPPTLAELAAAACVSPFHFHRIWRGLTGETVGQTLARLRADAAKPMLLAAGASVTRVAQDLGFGSSQGFARAFRQQTGMTPSAYAASAVDTGEGTDAGVAEVRLVVREGVKVVALWRTGGAYVALNSLFERVWRWAGSNGRLANLEAIYGIPCDDPVSVAAVDLRYAACFAFSVPGPSEPFVDLELPRGPHALLRHIGAYDGLEAKTQWLLGDWLPRSGLEPADAPVYHHFHNDPDRTPESDLVTDILLALEPTEDPAP